jgi:hypothetical protein
MTTITVVIKVNHDGDVETRVNFINALKELCAPINAMCDEPELDIKVEKG